VLFLVERLHQIAPLIQGHGLLQVSENGASIMLLNDSWYQMDLKIHLPHLYTFAKSMDISVR
jgi:hypothetical protein